MNIHQIENEDEEIEVLTQKLIKELEFIPTDGINTFESILLENEIPFLTFDNYLDHLQKTLKKCTCQASWIHHTLAIHCDDCRKSSNSCICVHCFLKGNHQGHKVHVTHSTNGTCDCGDPLLWSHSGFCSDHPGPEPNPELTQLDKDTRIKLISISKAAFHYYLDFASFNKKFFMNVTDWLIRLVSLGDATRRCVCIAMRDSFEFIDLYTHCLNFEKAEITKLLEFLGSLTNDDVFRTYFSSSFLRYLPKFIWINHRVALENTDSKKPPLLSLSQLFGFTFHATTTFTVQKLVQESQIDWIKILNESLQLIISYCFSQMSKKYNENSRRYSSFIKILSVFKSAFFVYGSTSPEIIGFVENLAKIYISKEFSFPITRVFGEKLDDPKKIQDVVFSIYNDMLHFVCKISSREIYTTKPLELMKKFFDSSVFKSIDKNANNLEIVKSNVFQKKDDDISTEKINHPKKISDNIFDESLDFPCDDPAIEKNIINIDKPYYKSVLSKNVQFAQTFPTHILAYQCLNLKDGRKTLRDYISEVTDDVEEFIKNWALIPLRWVAASDLSEYSLFVRNTQDVLVAMHSFKYRKNIKFKFSPLFSLLQALMKTTNNVDDFLLMIISTYGFFDQGFEDENGPTNDGKPKPRENQLDDNKKRLLLLTIFHFISCLIFDTLCKEKNFFTMRRLVVISRLMEGNLSLEEINSIWYNKVLSDEKFCDDLQSFASRVQTKNGTKFHLTDSSEWHPLLPFLSLSSIIPLIQNFIQKNPDSLINFPKLPLENQRVLFSPVLWALEYHILTHKECKDYQIVQQLIFNVLIITANNSECFYQQNESENEKEFVDDENSILYAGGFCDLFKNLSNLKFDQFLKKKIVYVSDSKSQGLSQTFPEGNAVSMIDLLSGLGNIGLTVLERMNISGFDNHNLLEDGIEMSERMQKNRERANKLKMQIMTSFNEKQKQFKLSTTQSDEITENVQNFECSICHIENKDDCFVFPALIYISPLSTYIKWRFRKAKLINSQANYNSNENENDGADNSGNTNDFSDIPESFDLYTAVRICLHPIHSNCIQKDEFSCPTDRCPRNASLPIIAGIYDYNPITDKSVLNGVNSFVKKAYYNSIKYAVYSLASEVEILEMRHRSNPGCLDNITTAATLRNVYLCIWHAMREKAQKTLGEEEIRRRKRIIIKAVKNEMIRKSATPKEEDDDDDLGQFDLTWSQMKEQLSRYHQDLPEINSEKTIDANARSIIAALLPAAPKSSKQSENKPKKQQNSHAHSQFSILHSLIADFGIAQQQQRQNANRMVVRHLDNDILQRYLNEVNIRMGRQLRQRLQNENQQQPNRNGNESENQQQPNRNGNESENQQQQNRNGIESENQQQQNRNGIESENQQQQNRNENQNQQQQNRNENQNQQQQNRNGNESENQQQNEVQNDNRTESEVQQQNRNGNDDGQVSDNENSAASNDEYHENGHMSEDDGTSGEEESNGNEDEIPFLEYDDDDDLVESEFETFYDESGQQILRKRISLSPLMKYILFTMEADDESQPSGFELSMQDFINGRHQPSSIRQSDLQFKKSKITNNNNNDDDEVDDDDDLYEIDFFRDMDTVKDLSSDYQMLQFLRCVAIFDHFARDSKITQQEIEEDGGDSSENKKATKNDEFIDWDAILSSAYLHSHYKIRQSVEGEKEEEEGGNDTSHKVMQLPMFSFVDIPQNFLDFVHPPYSAPILANDEGNVALCLLTGKKILFPSEAQFGMNRKYIRLESYLKDCLKKSFGIFLYLNGGSASQVFIASLDFNLIMPLHPFYVDKFGDKDIGIKRGSLLYLSDSKKEDIIDMFLSGSWTNSFKWQNA